MKDNLKNLLFSVLACAIILAGIEAGLRIAKPAFVCRTKAATLYNRITFKGIAPELYDEKYIETILNTKEIPLFRGKNKRWLEYMEERNSRGFRGPEFSEKKDADLRIICLGDSITWDGWYLDTLEKGLEKRFPKKRIEIINCGLPGRPSLAGLELFKEEIKNYQPDIVVFSYAINDANYHQTEKARRASLSESRPLRLARRALNSSNIYLALKAGVRKARDISFDPVDPGDFNKEYRFSPFMYKENLAKLIGAADQEGIRLVFFTSHSPFYYPELERYNHMMEAVAKEHGVVLVNTRKAMLTNTLEHDDLQSLALNAEKTFSPMIKELMGSPELMDKILHPTYIFYYDFFHPNRKGHEIIGMNLAELMIKEGLIQQTQDDKEEPEKNSSR